MPSEKTSSEQTKSDGTPTSEEQDYEAHSRAQRSNSVYDFLYQDVRRVASFLAQFEEYGVRQSVKATESVGNTQTLRGSATGTIGLPSVMGGSANLDSTTADETKDIAEHVFDPLWSNSRRLLNYLQEHDLIVTNIEEAMLGQFVLIKGSLSILDTALLGHALQDSEFFEIMHQTACKENNINPNSEAGKEAKLRLRLISKIPSSTQMFIYSTPYNFWTTLTHESLVTGTNDLSAKHGAIIRGGWNVLGILDAFPDFRSEPTEDDPDPKTLDELGVVLLSDGFIKVTANFTNLIREHLGRPRSHFGMLPILIFREVSGRGTED